uniref:Uncharacterized protein n=1 Tax=Salix viminalis TaxID=40686 RepID=A0A6N2LAL5_SALVM
MGETGMTLKELRRVFPSPPIAQISSSSSLDFSSPPQQLWIAKIYHPASWSSSDTEEYTWYPSPLLQASTSSQLTADFSSYEEACNQDPELKSFDVTLHGRINHVIKILADGVELRSLGSFKEVKNSVEIRSLGSFKEVTNCLLEMNQDVVKVILESKEDIWDNPELFDLVEEYFKSSVKTMEFCTALGSCLERAQNSQLIIQLAINQFEQEVEMEDGQLR